MAPEPRAYDQLRDLVPDELGSFRDLLLVAPDLVLLLTRLARDSRVPQRYKLYLAAGAAYLMMPVDILPRRTLGPIGALDDLVVAVVVLNQLLNRVDPQVVSEHWSGKGDILRAVQDAVGQADRWIGADRLATILQGLGLGG